MLYVINSILFTIILFCMFTQPTAKGQAEKQGELLLLQLVVSVIGGFLHTPGCGARCVQECGGEVQLLYVLCPSTFFFQSLQGMTSTSTRLHMSQLCSHTFAHLFVFIHISDLLVVVFAHCCLLCVKPMHCERDKGSRQQSCRGPCFQHPAGTRL